MTQENKPRFSHVVIGETPNQEDIQSDEEVITISAGRLVTDSHNAAGDNVVIAGSKPNAQDMRMDALELNQDDTTKDTGVQDLDIDDDLGIDAPMPLVQRVVLLCCAIGFVAAIVLVVWHFVAAG